MDYNSTHNPTTYIISSLRLFLCFSLFPWFSVSVPISLFCSLSVSLAFLIVLSSCLPTSLFPVFCFLFHPLFILRVYSCLTRATLLTPSDPIYLFTFLSIFIFFKKPTVYMYSSYNFPSFFVIQKIFKV